jgi:phosphoribosyl 1,2-cyclic phosphate phosphodiesterase
VSGYLRLTILGCGSSGGVPRPDGDWGACDPNDPRNARTRCSLLVERCADAGFDPEATTIVLVDTSPDLRAQLLRHRVRRIDAVIYTHDHADQCHGVDDLRALVYRNRKRITTYMDPVTRASLESRFRYIFQSDPESGYPAILEAHAMPALWETWAVDGPGGPIPVQAVPQTHGAIQSLGFRFGPAGYCNDVNDLSAEALNAMQGLELWIVDALRDTPHPSHAHVALALDWIAHVKPARAVLTNMHIDLDFATLAASLPAGVEPAVDGWHAVLRL